jgi:ABC-2 type transport system permease protein
MTATLTPAALPAPAMAPGADAGQTSMIASTLSVAKRTILKFVRSPQLIVVGTIQGAMFLLIFRYVFGGAINTGGVGYVDFLVPGFVATGVLFAGMAGAAGMAEDRAGGFLDRLRSLPIPRLSVLSGRALAETALMTEGTFVSVAIGFAVGFRLHGGAGGGLAALALCVLYGFCFCWLFLAIGLLAGSAQAAQGMSLLVFPLTFVSSAYVPVHTMPGWLQAFANNQPLTMMTNAVRALADGHRVQAMLGHSTGYWVGASLLWCAILLVIFAPLTAALYRRGR